MCAPRSGEKTVHQRDESRGTLLYGYTAWQLAARVRGAWLGTRGSNVAIERIGAREDGSPRFALTDQIQSSNLTSHQILVQFDRLRRRLCSQFLAQYPP